MNAIMNIIGIITYFLWENNYTDYACKKQWGRGRAEGIVCEKVKIAKAQVICTFTKTELNIYDGISTP